MTETRIDRPIRYAVVGAGWISQAAVLPAFRQTRSSALATLVSGDATKRDELARRYGLARTYSYDEYEACLRSGGVDAVYIALPNTMHRAYAERAARAGVHVLCEKPMATTEDDCRAMIQAAKSGGVKLMIAYRLHFEPANLSAVEAIASGAIGETRYFESTISQHTEAGIRLDASLGGGALFDAGIYCVNAARYLLRDEPSVVFGMESNVDERFRDAGVDETTSAMLAFPSGRIAQLTCSFGAAHTSALRVVGTRGEVILDPAYGFQSERKVVVRSGGAARERVFPAEDQFGPEIDYFSECVIDGAEPEPSGEEGLADVRVLAAIKRSIAAGAPVSLPELRRAVRPTMAQVMYGGPLETPPLVGASSAAG